MEKEFNLSEKNKCLVNGQPTKDNYYLEKDVKEFIKLLKEEFGDCRDKTDVWADEERWNKFEKMFKKKLGELAGKNLK